MSGRKKTTLANIGRSVPSTTSPTKRNVPQEKVEILTTEKILATFYPDLSADLVQKISSLDILHPKNEDYEPLLLDVIASYLYDPVTTDNLLSVEYEDIDDLYLQLPSMEGSERLHIKSVEEEFRAVTGATMGFACKKCKGHEFYFDADRQTGGLDEASKSQIFCAVCKPRY